jgi:hypothetical protein
MLNRGSGSPNNTATPYSAAILDTDEFRAQLGRIACGYDGGQIDSETQNDDARH